MKSVHIGSFSALSFPLFGLNMEICRERERERESNRSKQTPFQNTIKNLIFSRFSPLTIFAKNPFLGVSQEYASSLY